MEKATALRELARRRKATRWPGYSCVGDYHEGIYECDFVSPYSKSACNMEASLMVFLQDWASDAVLDGPVLPARIKCGHDPKRLTNRRLKELLRQHFGLQLKDIYATNVFPFVKPGSMSTAIPPRDLVRAAHEFALPQLEIIRPRIAVCLGKAAYNAVAVASGHQPAARLPDALFAPFRIGETEVWCQAHLGRNSVARVSMDWARLALAYNFAVE